MVSVELGLCDSREDRDGHNPNVDNQSRMLTGYQRSAGDDLTINGQHCAERMLGYDGYRRARLDALQVEARTRHNVTELVTRLFNDRTSQVSLFAWVSPSHKD